MNGSIEADDQAYLLQDPYSWSHVSSSSSSEIFYLCPSFSFHAPYLARGSLSRIHRVFFSFLPVQEK